MLGGFTNTVARLFGNGGVSSFFLLARRADTCNKNYKTGQEHHRVTTHTRHGVVIPFCIIKTVNGELALCHRACSHLDYNTELCLQCLEFFCHFRHFFFDICELHTRTLSLADI